MKTSRKTIKVTEESKNLRYITIYEVWVKLAKDGSHLIYERFIDEKEAEAQIDFIKETHPRYESAWVRKQFVWC